MVADAAGPAPNSNYRLNGETYSTTIMVLKVSDILSVAQVSQLEALRTSALAAFHLLMVINSGQSALAQDSDVYLRVDVSDIRLFVPPDWITETGNGIVYSAGESRKDPNVGYKSRTNYIILDPQKAVVTDEERGTHRYGGPVGPARLWPDFKVTRLIVYRLVGSDKSFAERYPNGTWPPPLGGTPITTSTSFSCDWEAPDITREVRARSQCRYWRWANDTLAIDYSYLRYEVTEEAAALQDRRVQQMIDWLQLPPDRRLPWSKVSN